MDFITIFGVCIGATLAAIIAANVWNSKSRRDRRMADKKEVGQEVERITDEKMKEQAPLDDLERSHTKYKIESLETKILQGKTDLADHIKDEARAKEDQNEIDKQKKSKSERYL